MFLMEKMTMSRFLSACIAATVSLASAPAFALFDTEVVCSVENAQNAVHCKKGDKMVFLPSVYGNERLPLAFIGAHCDGTKPIYHNKSGVVCYKNGGIEEYSADNLAKEKK